MTQNLSGIWSEALIGRQSSYIVLTIVYEWQTKDKRPQRSNVKAKKLEQNSQYLLNILFSRRRIWVLLELVGRWTQKLPKSTRRTVKLYKFVFGTPWLPDFLCKHWFASSVWNFCHWVADVPPDVFAGYLKRSPRTFGSLFSGWHFRKGKFWSL